jgi:branched-chain amino acid transport system ATP-binding protein
MSAFALELRDVETYYGESQVLWGMSIHVEPGSVVGILGRNGMGKTTTLHSVIGFTPPRRGKVLFNGKEVTNLEPYVIAKMGIALVPQGRRIFPSLTVKENLTMAARGAKKSDAWSLEKVFGLFPALKARASHKGDHLSGGEQQMLCIGRALMTNPDLLLMDEPSEGLAPLIVEELGNTIRELNKRGLSILLVEQNITLACEVTDFIYVIDKGKVVYQSTPEALEEEEKIKDVYIGLSR